MSLPLLNLKELSIPKLIIPKINTQKQKTENAHIQPVLLDSSKGQSFMNDNEGYLLKSEETYYKITNSKKKKIENGYADAQINSDEKFNIQTSEDISMIAQKIVVQYSGLKDIAGLDDVKQSLREAIIYPTKYPHLFSNGRTVWSRALLYGVTGVGKTSIVHAVAAEANLPLYQVSSADITSSWFGQSEKLIRRLFQVLGNKRCLLLIDEVDALCRKTQCSDSSHCRRMTSELLIQIQNYEGSSMFLICTTNCPWEIDAAFLRRFQQRIYVPLPDYNARKQIILSNICDSEYIMECPELINFIERTKGLTGSDLINMTRSASMIPMREMQTTYYWIEKKGGYMVPTKSTNENSVKCCLEEIPNSKVLCRPIKLDDLWVALRNTEITVTKEDIIPFEKFKERRAIKQ